MEPTTKGSGRRPSGMARYGPVVGIVAVAAVVAVAVVVLGGGDGDGPPGPGQGAGGAGSPPAGVVSWSDAVAAGTVDGIDWGSRCDTSRGRLAYPSFFAGECYAPFDGDNGGATAPGVTADSIKVVQYLTPENDPVIDFITREIATDDTNAETAETLRGFTEFYQAFHETYGRRVDLVIFEGTGPSEDEVAARADAVTIAEQIRPFAVLGGPLLTPAFADELAARGVLCIGCTPGQSDRFYQERSPYVWGVTNNPEQGQAHVAEYIGKRLAGRPAQHAGDPALQPRERVFGLVYLTTGAESERVVEVFEGRLADRGVQLAEVLSYPSPVELQTSAPQLIARLKSAGVTSVVFAGDPVAPGALTRAATDQGYFPEWVVTGSALVDTTTFARTYDQRQWAHAFGVSTLAARVSPDVAGAAWLYEWYFGTPPPAATGAPTLVPALNLFFVVIQAVGPNLTPETFRDALFAADPTPRAVSQPSLSYGDKGIWPTTDYLGIDDATEIWWDPNATGPDEIGRQGTGMYRYVDGGRRYLPGAWPDTPPAVFDPAGTVTIYTEPPPGETVPDYPSPRGR